MAGVVVRAHFLAPPGAPVTCLGVVDMDTLRTWGPDGGPATFSTAAATGVRFAREATLPYRGVTFAVPGSSSTPPDFSAEVTGEPISRGPGVEFSTTTGNTQYDLASKRWLICAITAFKRTDAQVDVVIDDLTGRWSPVVSFRNVGGRLRATGSPGGLVKQAELIPSARGGAVLGVQLPPSKSPKWILLCASDRTGKALLGDGAKMHAPSGASCNLELGTPAVNVGMVTVRVGTPRRFLFRNVNLQPR